MQRSHVTGQREFPTNRSSCVCVSMSCCLFLHYQDWKEAMDVVRLNAMTKKKFLNLAWQIYVDRLLNEGSGDLVTTEVSGQMISPPVPQHEGSLENAVRSAMPGLDPPYSAAEEVVDSCIVEEVAEGRIPYQVFSPVHTPEQDTHSKVETARVEV